MRRHSSPGPGLVVQHKSVDAAVLVSRSEGRLGQNGDPSLPTGNRTDGQLGLVDFLGSSAGALHAAAAHLPRRGTGHPPVVLEGGVVVAAQVGHLDGNAGSVVAGEVGGVEFQCLNVFEAARRGTELDDGPVVSGDALPARLPPVHHLALGTVQVGDEGGRAVQEQIVGGGEPFVGRKQNVRTRRSRCAVDEAMGCNEILQFVGSHLSGLGGCTRN